MKKRAKTTAANPNGKKPAKNIVIETKIKQADSNSAPVPTIKTTVKEEVETPAGSTTPAASTPVTETADSAATGLNLALGLKAVENQVARIDDTLRRVASDASASVGFTFHFFSWPYLSRLAFTIVGMCLTGFLNAVASSIAGWRNPNVIILDLNGNDSGERKLPDLGHEFVAYIMGHWFGTQYVEYSDLPDHLIRVFYPLTACFICLHPKRFAILRRMCAVYGLINALRMITVSVTSLPDPSPHCRAQFGGPTGAYKNMSIWPHAVHRALKVLAEPGYHHTCGDMVFSGHSVLLVMCCMVFQEYCTPTIFSGLVVPNSPIPLLCSIVRKMFWVATIVGLLSIVGTRLHYTLDVLIATYITVLLWETYHYHMKSQTKGKKFDWALKVLRWLEAEEVLAIDDAALEHWKRRGVLKMLKVQR